MITLKLKSFTIHSCNSSIGFNESLDIINILVKTESLKDFTVNIKPHPLLNFKVLQNILVKSSLNFYKNGNINSLLKKMKL